MKTDQSNSADIIAVIGSTGCGKGVYIKNYWLKKSVKRLLIWDYMREYAPFVTQCTAELKPVIASLKGAQFQVAFLPSYDDKQRKIQFDVFCKAAVHAGNLSVIVEELSFVTSPSFAPAGWKMVSSIGRHKGLRVIGASQRPAQVDKAFWSNCTEIHCGFLNYEEDQKVMAKVLGVKIDEIKALEPLQYIHKNVRTKEITRGFVKVP
jgi:hypothetical protein